MSGDAGKDLLSDVRRLSRRGLEWLMRPQTVRVVGPVAFLLGVALVAAGLLVVPSDGGGGGGSSRTVVTEGEEQSESGGVFSEGVAYRVPPRMVKAFSFLVPPVQPSAGFRLIIDSLDVNAGVVALGLSPDDVPQVPNEGGKVAWYEFSAKPGTGGNAVLAAHVRWAGDPGAFAKIDELGDGDLVRLAWDDGSESVYEVFESLAVDVKDPDSLHVMDPADSDMLTLITCGGSFVADRDNPLGGDFTERTVVKARLVEPNVTALSR